MSADNEELQAAYDAADAEPWIEGDTILPRTERHGLGPVRGSEYGTTYFIEYVRQVLRDEYGFTDEQIYGGGLRVYTTIDLEKQEQARSAIAARLAGVGPSAAIVSIDPRNGHIVAMASSSDRLLRCTTSTSPSSSL